MMKLYHISINRMQKEKKMKNKVTVAIQLLPIHKKVDYAIIDKAIEMLTNSGMKYKVCPLETVVEGDLDIILDIVKEIRNMSIENGAESVLINMKIHAKKNEDATIEEKMKKYEN